MRRTVVILLTLVALLAVTFGPALAVTDGWPDGNGHPYVGLMVADDANGNPLWRCSGTLISPTVFLTAGHCTETPAVRATIWFESDIQSQQTALGYPYGGKTSVDGTTYTHPLYYSSAWYMHDLGVVVLDKPYKKVSTFGALPTLGVLDGLATQRGLQDVTFTAVGYGLQKSFPDAAAWKDAAYKIRMVATPHLIQIDGGIVGDYSLLLSNNANTGGTCFGDSGGPNFIGGSNVIAGVTSFGMNGTCGGTGGVYRVDTADDLEWLATFGVAPPG